MTLQPRLLLGSIAYHWLRGFEAREPSRISTRAGFEAAGAYVAGCGDTKGSRKIAYACADIVFEQHTRMAAELLREQLVPLLERMAAVFPKGVLVNAGSEEAPKVYDLKATLAQAKGAAEAHLGRPDEVRRAAAQAALSGIEFTWSEKLGSTSGLGLLKSFDARPALPGPRPAE